MTLKPVTIYIRCDACGEVHHLRVIRLLSSFRKGRFLVWCKNNKQFYNLWKV